MGLPLARQLVSCFLVILCVCVSSQGAGVTVPRRRNERLGGGHLFFPSLCPSLPAPVSLQGGGNLILWPPSLFRSFSLHCLPLPRRKMGYAQQGRLLPTWSCCCVIEPALPRQISLRGRHLRFPAAPHPSLATDDRLGSGADVRQVTGLMAEEGRGQRPADSQWREGSLGRPWAHSSWAAPQITAPGGGMSPGPIHPQGSKVGSTGHLGSRW